MNGARAIPFLRLAPATLSLDELRARLDRLTRAQRESDDEALELAVELFERTDGREGIDPRLRAFLRLT